MSNKFDPHNLVILKEEYLDKGIKNTHTISLLMGRTRRTIQGYLRRLKGTYIHQKKKDRKKHKIY